MTSPGRERPAGRTASTAFDDLETVARIVATVDLERALVVLGQPATDREGAAPDALLGARVVVLPAGTLEGGGEPIALAEPTTEGRLAATLARHDEGPVGRYVAAPEGEGLAGVRARAARLGIPVSRSVAGPFGTSFLILDRPATGPHLIVVESRSLPSGS